MYKSAVFLLFCPPRKSGSGKVRIMQKSMWLWAFLPYLHLFGSLVNGAVVLSSPSTLTHLDQPSRLNNGPYSGLSVIDKERGPVLPAAELFETGMLLMAVQLAPRDYFGFVPSQAWSLGDFILGVTVNEQQGGEVSRAVVLNAFYFIFLLMKQEKNFRSGVFEIKNHGDSACDIVIFSKASSGLHLAPSFPHITQLQPPPSPIADNTKNSSQLEEPDLGLRLEFTIIMPYLIHPMDELDEMINFMNMLLTIAEPPANETVYENTQSMVPSSGAKLALNLTQDDVPKPLTYDDLISAVNIMSLSYDTLDYPGQGVRGEIYLNNVYQGELTLVRAPSTSSPSTNSLIGASVNASLGTAIEPSLNASLGTATARKRWFMA